MPGPRVGSASFNRAGFCVPKRPSGDRAERTQLGIVRGLDGVGAGFLGRGRTAPRLSARWSDERLGCTTRAKMDMATTITRDNVARNHRVREDTENGASCFLVDPWHERSAPPCPLFLSVSFVTRWFERGLAAGPRARRSVGVESGFVAPGLATGMAPWGGSRHGGIRRLHLTETPIGRGAAHSLRHRSNYQPAARERGSRGGSGRGGRQDPRAPGRFFPGSF